MDTKTKKRVIILSSVLAVLVVIAIGVYIMTSRPISQPSDSLSINTSPEASENSALTGNTFDGGTLDVSNLQSEVGRELVELVRELRSIKLDDSFVDTPAFSRLTDHTVDIEEQDVGRDNPFAPVPGVDASSIGE